jgi:hypothetical protein
MKRIIASVCAIILSPLAMAEYPDDIPAAKESVYSLDAIMGKKNADKTNQNSIDEKKPRLENCASYNDFLKAMYLYKRNEEQTIRPNVSINLPPSTVQQALENTPIDANKDITVWGEDLPSEYVILGE